MGTRSGSVRQLLAALVDSRFLNARATTAICGRTARYDTRSTRSIPSNRDARRDASPRSASVETMRSSISTCTPHPAASSDTPMRQRAGGSSGLAAVARQLLVRGSHHGSMTRSVLRRPRHARLAAWLDLTTYCQPTHNASPFSERLAMHGTRKCVGRAVRYAVRAQVTCAAVSRMHRSTSEGSVSDDTMEGMFIQRRRQLSSNRTTHRRTLIGLCAPIRDDLDALIEQDACLASASATGAIRPRLIVDGVGDSERRTYRTVRTRAPAWTPRAGQSGTHVARCGNTWTLDSDPIVLERIPGDLPQDVADAGAPRTSPPRPGGIRCGHPGLDRDERTCVLALENREPRTLAARARWHSSASVAEILANGLYRRRQAHMPRALQRELERACRMTTRTCRRAIARSRRASAYAIDRSTRSSARAARCAPH